MKKTKTKGLIVLVLVLAFIMSGCMGMTGQGRLDTSFPGGDRSILQTLVDDWQDYDVSYAGYYAENAIALVFDRKDDNLPIRLPGANWAKVSDKKTLKLAVNGMQVNNDFFAKVWRIVGPDDRSHGYLYTGWNLVNVYSTDANAVTITGIPAAWDGHHHF